MGQAKKKGQIKEKIKEASEIIAKEKEKIAKISPCHNYLIKDGKDKKDIKKSKELFDEDAFLKRYNVRLVGLNTEELNKEFIDALTKLLSYDYAVEKLGIKQCLENREDAYEDFVYHSSVFKTGVMVKLLEELEDFGLLAKITQYRIRQYLYAECDDLYNSDGRKLAELAFNGVEYFDIQQMLTIEMEKRAKDISPNIRQHMNFEDAKKLDEMIKKGEPFTIYRGFLIDPLEMVRGEGMRTDKNNVEEGYIGRKADGDEYFRKWNAGKGISFTFDKDIAGWFCYYQLTFGEKSTYNTPEDKRTIWSKRDSKEIPDQLRTKEDFIDYFGDTYQLRLDALGKKAIICELLINPKDIKGFAFGKSEAEINVLPEDAKVMHYEICGGNKISASVYDTFYRKADKTKDLQVYSKTKVSILNFQDPKTKINYQVFADKEEIEDKVAEIKDVFYKDGRIGKQLDRMKIYELFKDAAIELPKEYNPYKLTKDFWDFLLRRPERKLRKKGMVYIVN